MADLRIDLAAEFKGKKAFKEADSAVGSLDKAVGKLGKQIASVFAAQKIYAFGKASLKAFAEDQASAARLAKTVDNLGLSFANPAIDQFMKKLEMQSGIVDETLRPAFQALLTTTGDVSKSMSLLTNAIDISRGSGVDLATVTQDLANGYVGITRGLKKYNLGLSQAQLKSKSFNEIMGLLNKQFSGASAAYLDTYAGKMDILNTAADNAKETIGKGLVDALSLLAGKDQNVQDIANSMQGLADNTANAVVGLGVLIEKFKHLPGHGFGIPAVISEIASAVARPYMDLANLGKKSRQKSTQSNAADFLYEHNMGARQTAAAKAKAAADKKAADLAKAQVKSQKALTAEQKKQAALKKDGTIFDMQQIELIAALKGKLSDDDRKRAELQLALLDGNVQLADQLSKQILMAQDSTGKLYQYFLSIGDAKVKNPFAFLDEWLASFQEKLNTMLTGTPSSSSGGGIGGTTISSAVSSNPAIQGAFNDVMQYQLANGSTAAQAAALALDSARYTALGQSYAGYSSSTPSITVNVAGSVIKEQELIDLIQNGTQLASLSGSPSQIGRIAGMFG